MMTDKILQKIQELETEIINTDFPNVSDVKNKVRLMLENLSKMGKMVLDIKEQAAIDNIMATHNCSQEEAMFIYFNADGVDFVNHEFYFSKGKSGIIDFSYTRAEGVGAYFRSSYRLYWRFVNGKKEYIWND